MSENYKDRFEGCKKEENKEKQAECLFELLYDVTRLQDTVQLAIPELNRSMYHIRRMTNNGNAVMLGASQTKGRIDAVVRRGYLAEHLLYLTQEYNRAVSEHNESHKNEPGFNRAKQIECPNAPYAKDSYIDCRMTDPLEEKKEE